MSDEIKKLEDQIGEEIKEKPKKEKKTKEVAVKNEAPVNNPDGNPMALIAQAVDKKVDVATMEKLMDLQERWERNMAKKAFDKAMAAFQAECPTINKTRVVKNKDGTVRYKFAPIEAIIDQVKGLLEKNGFSYSIDVQYENNIMKSICKITHERGHVELSTFPAPIDPQGFMNEAQKFASASTFAKRYAFCNAFGILTGEDDDDSITSGVGIDPVDAAIEMVKQSKNVEALQSYKTKIMEHKTMKEESKSRIVEAVDEKIQELSK